ncbi:hypothetical protein V3C99_006257, partial [Haemonchus contortus]
MSGEDPLINGVPISSLRVVDLRDELDKRGLSKIGNKSALTERLKTFITENAGENGNKHVVGAKLSFNRNKDTDNDEKSSAKLGSPENPLVAAYLARQAEALEAQRREAERLRKESEEEKHPEEREEASLQDKFKRKEEPNREEENRTSGGIEDKCTAGMCDDIEGMPKKNDPRSTKINSPMSSMDKRSSPSPNLFVKESCATNSPAKEGSVSPSVKRKAHSSPEGKRAARSSAKEMSPSSTEQNKALDQDVEVDEINDEGSERTVSVDGEPEEEKQSEGEDNTQHSHDSEATREAESKILERKVQKSERAKVQGSLSKNKGAPAKPVEENGDRDDECSGEHLEELDYGEAEVEGDAEAEDKETKDEVLELDEAEEREIRKLKRRLIAEKKTPHEHEGGDKKRKVSPSRHPESDIVHIRGLTRPFTDRALKAEITKSGGQIVDFWIDSVKSHCIVQ